MAATASYSDADSKLGLSGEAPASMHTNKRKRGSLDLEATASRPAPGDSARASTNNSGSGTADFLSAHNASNSGDDDMQHTSSLIFDQLAQHNSGEHGMHQNGGSTQQDASNTAAAALSHYSMTVPQATELQFQTQTPSGEGGRPLSASFNLSEHDMHQQHGMPDFSGLDALKTGGQPSNSNDSPPNSGGNKPPVGSDEWHKVRRDNHKEVERRRRETINEGINELAKIVPGCEKNKGSILQRAVQFITQLKENESQNIEKWTLEKLLTDQAIAELSTTAEKFKTDYTNAYAELQMYKRACEKAGIVPDEFPDDGEGSNPNGDS
ncbi:hypothetical protein W97_00947 [Coniosporium apollinis CBS 100218]|uniref:BHLH domain-containing protein n=1 Tax=Coniosporium apollinis (strain CBS 100218) TaxID=1168221 RepID=R7YJC6_CONA1|nr:uncharacterized protein W97_00947 [Coniosporium apollinis CBS 100218]EON61731.1 hypothetical protein W97_00947 [Coniosporium apollinis CBS 100218]